MTRNMRFRAKHVASFLLLIAASGILLLRNKGRYGMSTDRYNGAVTELTRYPEDIVLQGAMQDYASSNGTIILASVDYGYIEMAINLYATSFYAKDIDNYLFVASEPRVCHILRTEHIHCANYIQDKDGMNSSDYGTKAFNRKTHRKSQIVLVALKIGLTVLLTDLDIVFFRNPFPFLSCLECDIQMQDDLYQPNSGFYLVRPTPSGIRLMRRSILLGMFDSALNDQGALSSILKDMELKRNIKAKLLQLDQFPNGYTYFDEGHRTFLGDKPCDNCIIIHNNYIKSKEAKVYRFKEHGLWDVDIGLYYSDPSRKYIVYETPSAPGDNDPGQMDMNALKGAFLLGHLLNRTVILPKFSCGDSKWCSLVELFDIRDFDAQLSQLYREHVFLQHRKVPLGVKRSVSPLLHVDTVEPHSVLGERGLEKPASSEKLHIFRMQHQGPRRRLVKSMLGWLKQYQSYSIIKFANLCEIWGTIAGRGNSTTFMRKIERGLASRKSGGIGLHPLFCQQLWSRFYFVWIVVRATIWA